MTQLRKMMIEELERRNYSEGTTRRYLRYVERFAQHFGRSPDKLGPDHAGRNILGVCGCRQMPDLEK